jgi:acyl carrier protein
VAVPTVERIQADLGAALGIDPAALRPDASIYDDLGVDSLDFLEALAALEESLQVALPESTEFAANLRTVQDVIDAFRSFATAG